MQRSVLLGCLLGFIQLAHAELFTALVEMEELLDTEAVLMETLEGYIAAEEAKVSILRRHLEEFRTEHSMAQKNVQEYLNNPINAYLLTKRLTSNWKEVEVLMENDVGKDFVQNLTEYRTKDLLKFPTEEDLNGAAVALMRLQDTYKLETSSVARGELNGIQYSTKLTSNDCFELGRQSYQNKDFYHTVLWMTEAMDRYYDEENKTTTKPDILEYLAFSTYMEGNIRRALQMTNELLELSPNHERAIGNKIYYESALDSDAPDKKKGDDGDQTSPVEKEKSPYDGYGSYEKLCRGELRPAEHIIAKLKCKFVTRNHPYLKIGPLKVEEMYPDPYLLLFHDVLFDDEIETIKRLARPRFKRATVQNGETGRLETAAYRISKSGWLEEWEHGHVAAAGRRAELMTGLSMRGAESLQVVNYGIGGHYEPHYDFARKEEEAFTELGLGNRIATVLYYMSDVEQGGATVFPQLNVALRPRKGTAAVWMNLSPSGEGDLRTRHAACPVLTGSKFVCNKWFHEREQEFRRPCGLTEDFLDPPL